MATNVTKTVLENLFFCGTVCSVTPDRATARVVREDKNNKTTGELFVLQHGSANVKDYWMPAVGDQVLCIQMPNYSGTGVGDGFILGTYYNSVDLPPGGAASDTRVLQTSGNLKMVIGGSLSIEAAGGDVTVNGISLVNHTHGGVESGGSKTGKPE